MQIMPLCRVFINVTEIQPALLYGLTFYNYVSRYV